jgi:MFS family permease
LSTVIASVAKTLPVIIGGTAMLGLSAGAQCSYAIIMSELIQNRWRSLSNGLIALANTPFAIFGSIIIRTWVQDISQSWRWSYYLSIICNFIAMVFYYIYYHPPTFAMLHAHGRQVSGWKMVDAVSILTFVMGLLFLLLGISWDGEIYP